MIVKQYRNYFNETLKTIYPITEIDSFFFLLLEEYLGFRRVDIVLKSDFKITQETLNLLQSATKQLEQEVPLQYIIGKTEFYGLPFVVNKHVLIPRPETEELVAWIIEEVTKRTAQKNQKLSILDIGTGTGCIPISLAKNIPTSNVSAIDISQKALDIAKKNALLNDTEIRFFEMDILNTDHLPQQFDVMVSNPPYVRELEKTAIKKNVLQNEPHLALFVENDNPLLFYKKIADLAKKYLNKNGVLFFEINQYLGQETVKMLEKKGFTNIELRKDLFGNYRMIQCNINL